MSQNSIQIILSILSLFLIIKWIKAQVKDFYNSANNKRFFNLGRFKNISIVLVLFFLPVLLVNATSFSQSFHLDKDEFNKNNTYYAILISFFISLSWLLYILKLDLYNKEKKRHIFLIFILAVTFTSFAFIPYDFIHRIGFRDSTEPLQSFIYSVFGIGLIEESIKLFPLLILIKFTKAIDEPYDYILYASVSALGFAFVENSMYLSSYGLEIINARALYSTVAHMAFSSLIAYGLFLVHFKKTKINSTLVFISFFLLAILSHGFYDFWIMNRKVAAYSGLTTIFLLVLIHVWFVLINNTMNTSNFFDEKIKINNDKLKIYLVFVLLVLFMSSYIYVSMAYSQTKANSFLWESLVVYGYVMFYIVGTLSKYDIVKGLMRPVHLGLSMFNPNK